MISIENKEVRESYKQQLRVSKYEILEPITIYIVDKTNDNFRFIGPQIVKLDVGDTLTWNFSNYTIDKSGKRLDSDVVYGLPVKPLPKLKVTTHADYNKMIMNICA
jgi:glutathione peroxidase-family protein